MTVLPKLMACLARGLAVGAAHAQTPAGTAACQALMSQDFSHVQDAPLQLTEARVVQAQGKTPAYCRVTGYVWPQIGIEIHLPMSAWNGKFMEVGDGGYGGDMYLFLCEGPVRRGYACIASDMGHKGATTLGLWGENNLEAQADWGFRATHVTALAGRALVHAFYAKPPSRSYMWGWSSRSASRGTSTASSPSRPMPRAKQTSACGRCGSFGSSSMRRVRPFSPRRTSKSCTRRRS